MAKYRWLTYRWMTTCVLVGLLSSGCVFLQRVSVTSAGGQVLGPSEVTDVSNNGRFVVFQSTEQFDVDDTATFMDVFLHDALNDTTTRVSHRTDGTAPNGDSYDGRVSDDGRTVVFASDATDFGVGTNDNNNASDVVVFDIDEAAWPFYVGTTSCGGLCANTPNGASSHPDISADGNTVVWESIATNLVPGDTNGVSDVFRHRVDGTTPLALVSLTTDELLANGDSHRPSANFNAARVAFSSDATNLILGGENNGFRDIYHRSGSTTALVSRDLNGFLANGDSDNPRTTGLVAFTSFESEATDIVAGDTNGLSDVFLFENGQPTERVSVADDGSQITTGSGMSNLGIGFGPDRVLWSDGSGHLFVRDRDNGRTDPGSADANGILATATGGALGRNDPYVAFSTTDPLASNDTNGAADVYLRWSPNPMVTSVSPAVAAGATATVTITGERLSFVSGFLADTSLTWTNLVIIDDNTITASVTVAASAAPGNKFVNLTTPDGGPGQFSGGFANCQCLTVTN